MHLDLYMIFTMKLHSVGHMRNDFEYQITDIIYIKLVVFQRMTFKKCIYLVYGHLVPKDINFFVFSY